MRSGINYYGHRVDVLAPYDSYLKSNEPIRTPLIIILSKKIMVGLLSRIIIIHGFLHANVDSDPPLSLLRTISMM